jgi:hypothetical protein
MKLEALKNCIIKEFAKEDRYSWRVVKLSEGDEVSVSKDRGFEEIDHNPCVSCQAVIPALATQN